MRYLKHFKTAAVISMLALCGLQAVASAAGTDQVEKEKVWFAKSTDNIKLAGEMYYPEGFDQNKQYPSIVVVHPGGGVKEQTVAIYARKLAEKGYRYTDI